LLLLWNDAIKRPSLRLLNALSVELTWSKRTHRKWLTLFQRFCSHLLLLQMKLHLLVLLLLLKIRLLLHLNLLLLHMKRLLVLMGHLLSLHLHVSVLLLLLLLLDSGQVCRCHSSGKCALNLSHCGRI